MSQSYSPPKRHHVKMCHGDVMTMENGREKKKSFQNLTKIGLNLKNNLSVNHTLWAMQVKNSNLPTFFFYAPSTDPQRISSILGLKFFQQKKTSRDFHHPKASQSCSFMGEMCSSHGEKIEVIRHQRGVNMGG